MKRTLTLTLAMGVALSMALPSTTLAQGRSRSQSNRGRSTASTGHIRNTGRTARARTTQSRTTQSRATPPRQSQNRSATGRTAQPRNGSVRDNRSGQARGTLGGRTGTSNRDERAGTGRGTLDGRFGTPPRNGRDQNRRDDRYDRNDRNGYYGYDNRVGRARVVYRYNPYVIGRPSFCRSGIGHPVFGTRWCLDRGYGLGYYVDPWSRIRWQPVSWGLSFILRIPFGGSDYLDGGELLVVLGPTLYHRLDARRAYLGCRGPLVGRWFTEPSGLVVLRVFAGDVPVALLSAPDRYHPVDDIMLNPGY